MPKSRKQSKNLAAKTIEAELKATVQATGLAHQRALLRRLGWDGQPPVTLQEAGETIALLDSDVQVTRERIRQIEERLLKQLRTHVGPMPVLQAAYRHLTRMPMLHDELVTPALKRAGLTKADWRLRGLLTAFTIFDMELPHEQVHYHGQSFWGLPEVDLGSVLQELEQVAVQLSGWYGCAQVAELRMDVPPVLAPWEDFLCSGVVEWNNLLQWIDGERSWFWQRGRAHSALRRAEKALIAVDTLDMDDLHQAVANSMARENRLHPMQDRVPNLEQLRRLFQALPQFALSGNRVRLTTNRKKPVKLSPSEAIALRMLQRTNQPVAGTDIVNAIMMAGASKALACGILARCPFVIRVGNNRYRLVGDDVDRRIERPAGNRKA